MTTLYLSPDSWDLAVDASRNIALAGYPYSVAQTVANACRLWSGEAPFNTERGIPYATDILGKNPPRQLMASWFEREAKTVPLVQTAQAVLEFNAANRQNRTLTGQIQVTLTDGTVINV